MPFDVEMPDGTIIEDIPDGTTKEQVLAKYNAMTGKTVAAPAAKTGILDFLPTGVPQWMQSKPGQGWDDANAQAAGGDVTNPMAYLSEAQKQEQGPAMQAVGQGVNRAVQVGAGLTKGAVINPVAAVAQAMGGETGRQFAQEAQTAYETQRANAGAEGFDWAELGGALISPVNRVLPGGAITGGVVGAVLNPVTGKDLSGEDVLRGKIEQAVLGGAFGAGTKTLLPALREGAQKLLNAGAELSPGQAFGGMGGFAMRTGEDIINTLKKFTGKETSSEKLNKAFTYVTLNEALSPIGKTISKVSDDGFAMVSQGRKLASEAYNDAFSKIGKVSPDQDLFTSIRSVLDDAQNTLDLNDFKKFEQEIRKNFTNKFKNVPGNRLGEGVPYEIDGQGLHNIKRFLQARLDNLSNATDELGMTRKGLYDQVMEGFKDYTYRVDPTGAIKAADTAWSNMYRVADAAKKAATNSGNFSPEQLMRSATTQTSTLVGGAGKGPLQQYAKEALRVIGKDTTENITPSDLKNIGVATGLGYTGLLNPVVLAAGATVGLTAELLGKLALKNPELYMKIRDEAFKQAGKGAKALTLPSQEQ
jgi:hypothetical protein